MILVRIINFPKGREGQGFTQFAIQEMSGFTYMDKNGIFGMSRIWDENVLGFNTEDDALDHAKANPNWVIESN